MVCSSVVAMVAAAAASGSVFGATTSASTAARRDATSFMAGRTVGSDLSICISTGLSTPARCGGSNSPDATRYSSAIELTSVPNGGPPSRAA